MKNSTKLKPRIMWANPIDLKDSGSNIYLTRKRDLCENVATITRGVFIPLDNVEAIVERAHEALQEANLLTDPESAIRSALTVAGIPCKRKTRK